MTPIARARRLVAVTTATLILLTMFGAAPAQASNDRGTRTANPYSMVFAYWNLSAQFTAAADWNINNNINPTRLNVSAVRVNQTQLLNIFDEEYNGTCQAF